MSRKIIVVESDQAYIGFLKKKLQNIGVKAEYEILTPPFDEFNFDTDELLVMSCVERTASIIRKCSDEVAGVFVDVRILEEKKDTLGIIIAKELKQLFPLIPVINITNHYQGNDINLFGEISLGAIDGVLPKSYFTDESFTKKKLTNIFEAVINKLKQPEILAVESNSNSSFPKADIAIVTALNSPEFSALKEYFKLKKVEKKSLKFPDTSNYYSCEHNYGGKTVTIVAATDSKMGMPATTSLATRIIQQFDPKYIVILGICAGIEGDTNIGDILVAEFCWDYGSGKHEVVEGPNKEKIPSFKPYHKPYTMNEGLRKDIADLSNKTLTTIQKKSKDFLGNTNALTFHIGPFVSGAAVISSTTEVGKIKLQDGKLIGFDMEAYGVFYAANNSKKHVEALSFKAVSDFGTENKSTSLKAAHQKYASHNSVLFFKEVLNQLLIDNIKNS